MVATGRRVRTYRKAMAVLGKVPVAPKPLNLPSQRLENLLGPDVDFVLRGGRLWPNALPATGDEESKPEVESSVPTSGGREEEDSSKEGKDTPKNVPSLGSTTDLPPSGGSQTVHRHSKMEALCGHASSNPARATRQETRKSPDPLPSRSGEGKNRGNIPSICYGSFSALGVPPPGFEDVGLRPLTDSKASRYEGFCDFQPLRSSRKEREIIVIHMVGHPGFYGSYPVQIGYSETVNRLANPPLQFGNVLTNLDLPQHGMLNEGAHLSTVPSPNLYDDHNGFICYEKECYGTAHDHGRRRNGRVHGNLRKTAFGNNAQRDAHETLLFTPAAALGWRSSSQKQNFKTPGRLRSTNTDTRVGPPDISSAKPVHFTLLKKEYQTKPSAENLKEEIDTCEVVGHAEGPVGCDSSACVNRKAPEKDGGCARLMIPPEDRNVVEAADVKKSEGDGRILVKQSKSYEPGKGFESLEAPAPQARLPQGNYEEAVLGKSVENDTTSCVDGCKLEVKHVIFDADNSCTCDLVRKGDAFLNSMDKGEVSLVDMEVSSNDSQSMFLNKKQEKPLFLQRSNDENKHKHSLAVPTINQKVLAPQWKPKKIPASVKPATKASKGTQKTTILMSKFPAVCDIQRRHSYFIHDSRIDPKHNSEISACEVEGDCLSRETTTETHEACKVVKGKGNESGGTSGRSGGREPAAPTEKSIRANGFKLEVKHVICSVSCKEDTPLNGVAMAKASSIGEETSGIEHQPQTTSHKHVGGKARSNSGSDNKRKDKNLVLTAKLGHKAVSPLWKPKVTVMLESKPVTKALKDSQAPASQWRESVVTPKHQNLLSCSLVAPSASVESSEEKGRVNARFVCNPQKNWLEKVERLASSGCKGRAVSTDILAAMPASKQPTISLKNVSEPKKLGRTSQREIDSCKVCQHTESISASPSSSYAKKNVCEGDGGECMSLGTATEALKADEDSIGLAGKVAKGHISKKAEAETMALVASTGHLNRRTRPHERSVSERESCLELVEGGLSPPREQGTIGDGCKVDVKHAIFDIDSCSTMGDGDAPLDGIAKADSGVTTKPSSKSYIIHGRTAREERMHEMVHKKYKEAGKWKPKAGYQAPLPADNVKNNHADHNENKVEAICISESQAGNHECKAGHSRTFAKKVCHRTAIEERIHQLVHRKYRETGQWKPKADREQVASTGRSIKRRAARIKVTTPTNTF